MSTAGLRPSELPRRKRSMDEFLQRIGKELSTSRPVDLPVATTAVFRTLSHHVNRGTLDKVREALPEEVRALCRHDPPAHDEPLEVRE